MDVFDLLKQNIRGVYNCVCCGRIVGTVPDHPGLR